MSRADGERYRRAFRWLLVVDLVVLPFVSSFVEYPLPEDSITIPLPWWLMAVFFLTLGALRIYATIALWHFRRSGRTAFMAATVITFAVPWWTFVDASALPPSPRMEEQLGGIASLVQGAILAMAFTEPIRSALR